ncbi:MAG: regulatory protein GemA [Rhodospirillaceae bacterium]
MSNPYKAIYAAAAKAGLNEDMRRDIYKKVTGKTSLRDMSPKDRSFVLAHLERLSGDAQSRKSKDPPQVRKIKALWISAYWLGITWTKDDQALRAFVLRQCKIHHEKWLWNADDAKPVAEALKGWLARAAGVDWAVKDPRLAVVQAQIRALHKRGEATGERDEEPTDTTIRRLGRRLRKAKGMAP